MSPIEVDRVSSTIHLFQVAWLHLAFKLVI